MKFFTSLSAGSAVNQLLKTFLVIYVALTAAACTRTGNTGPKSADPKANRKVEPWTTAMAEISRQPDLATVRRVLNTLNSNLAEAKEALPTFDAEAMTKAGALLNPSPSELTGWSSPTFTAMDANFVGESLFFRTVARSLDIEGQPVAVQARVAFDWTCRMIYNRAWELVERDQRLLLPAVPPQFVIKRGYGVGFDREAVFLALTRQLGLDAMLVGPPGAEQKARVEFDAQGQRHARGPFWALGVRDGDDVLLFDPWSARPITSGNGSKPVTLSEAKANPDAVLNFIRATNALPITAEAVRDAVAYVTAPVNAFPPRMAVLEEKFTGDFGVWLTVSIDGLATRTAKLPGGPVRWYGPPIKVDPYAVPHSLGSFLPILEGGYDATPAGPGQISFLLTQIEPLSGSLFKSPGELKTASARQQYFLRCTQYYKQMIADADFDEKIARGEFHDAIRQLRQIDEALTKERDRQRDPQLLEQVKQWLTAMNAAYEKLSLSALPGNEAGKTAAEMEVDLVWRSTAPAVASVHTTVAQVGAVEVSYWMALAKHEQAERSQRRFARARPEDAEAARGKASADWSVAKDEWDRHLQQAPPFEKSFPGRIDHARRLQERAAKLMANPARD
jgi:hypothetical protein